VVVEFLGGTLNGWRESARPDDHHHWPNVAVCFIRGWREFLPGCLIERLAVRANHRDEELNVAFDRPFQAFSGRSVTLIVLSVFIHFAVHAAARSLLSLSAWLCSCIGFAKEPSWEVKIRVSRRTVFGGLSETAALITSSFRAAFWHPTLMQPTASMFGQRRPYSGLTFYILTVENVTSSIRGLNYEKFLP